MKTFSSSFLLIAIVLVSLLKCFSAQQQYAATGSAAGSGSGSFPTFPQIPFQPLPPLQPLPYFNSFGNYGGFPFGGGGFPFQPFPYFDFNAYNLQLQNWIKASELQAQQAAANGQGKPASMNSFGSAAASFGPEGGFGQTFVYPPPKDELSFKFQDFKPPPPGTNRFGVSSFSSSSFSDNNGDKKGTQFSSVSVDDNGNITTIVSGDPNNNIALQGNVDPAPVRLQ